VAIYYLSGSAIIMRICKYLHRNNVGRFLIFVKQVCCGYVHSASIFYKSGSVRICVYVNLNISELLVFFAISG
jgi:hypothetical protein